MANKAQLLYKILVYSDAVDSGGTVEVVGPDDRTLAGAALADGVSDVVHIEHIEILTRESSAKSACIHVRCRLYCPAM